MEPDFSLEVPEIPFPDVASLPLKLDELRDELKVLSVMVLVAE
jgi:hypothetical protein